MKMFKKRQGLHFAAIVGLGALALLGAGCASTPQAPMTSLELQAFQRKTFEADKRTAFAATVSVFQDLGYTIQTADIDTGFITATSPSSTHGDPWAAMFFGTSISCNQIKATAFIEEIRPQETSIRLNFVDQRSVSSAYGQNSQQDKPLLNPTIYENAFLKIQEAVFIRIATS